MHMHHTTQSHSLSTVAPTDPAPVDGHDLFRIASLDRGIPASPLQHAVKLLSETTAPALLNPRSLEHINELALRATSSTTLLHSSSTPLPPTTAATAGAASALSNITPLRSSEYDTLVYPVGVTNGIDPSFAAHASNIPYSSDPQHQESVNAKMHDSQHQQPPLSPLSTTSASATYPPRKKGTQTERAWSRQPHILLVEDDPTCRRIGGRFLLSADCSVDNAVSSPAYSSISAMVDGRLAVTCYLLCLFLTRHSSMAWKLFRKSTRVPNTT